MQLRATNYVGIAYLNEMGYWLRTKLFGWVGLFFLFSYS